LSKNPIKLKLVSNSNFFEDITVFGEDYFECLNGIREVLEKNNILIACNGARRDVYPSSLLTQMSDGVLAYVCELGKPVKKENKVNIFHPADISNVCTVSEQQLYHRDWIKSL
jgi:hypothetical protein